MTGLESTDTILSISCILTTSDLTPLDVEGFNAVISHTQEQLSQMSEWCIKTHGDSGLTQQCLSSSATAEATASDLLGYIRRYIPEPRRALLAGNSIHADRAFLMVPPWSRILEHLHYRLFDVSAMKEMVRRWAADGVLMAAPQKQLKHTAREDVLESIEEARYYKTLIERMTSIPLSGDLEPQPTIMDSGLQEATGAPPMPRSAPAPVFVPLPPPPGSLPLGTKQGAEALTMLQNNGTKEGGIGNLDEGYRTDIA